MSSEVFPPISDPVIKSEIEALAKRHREASGIMMQVINGIGGVVEGVLEGLAPAVRDPLEKATEKALEKAFAIAGRSRDMVSDRPDWVNTTLTTLMGAAGGAGGLASSIPELSVTVTMLLRAIQGIAAEHGFNPQDEEVRLECLRVFAAAGPMKNDDGIDIAFFTARMAITGTSVNSLIAKVAPRLATALGQKLATQTVPVLGAVAGAAVNYAFTSYYQDIARVHFGLKRLARESGEDEGLLREELVMRITKR